MSHRKIQMIFSEGEKVEEANWLVSYGDTITILLCFFMIFFNISKSDPKIAKKIKEEFKSAGYKVEEKILEIKDVKEDSLDFVFDEKFKQFLEENKIEYEIKKREFIIRFKTDRIFESGSVILFFKARRLISRVADEIIKRKIKFDIYIEGHSDTAPLVGIGIQKWRSNWELSAARSVRVVDIFLTKGVEKKRLYAVGHGDSKPRVKDRDKYGRFIPKKRSINRRIEIRLQALE